MKSREPKPLIERVDSSLSRLPAVPIAQASRESSTAIAYPGLDPDVLSVLEERARAEVRAASELPLDPERSTFDRALLEEARTLGDSLAAERKRESELLDELRESQQARARLPAPMPRLGLGAVIFGQLVVTAIFAAAAAFLLTSSLDAFVLRGWVLGTFGASTRVAAVFALTLSSALSLALHLGQSVAVIARRGHVPGWLKSIFLGGDVLFASSFGLLRLSHAWSWQALALTVAELALLLCHTGLVLAFASLYASDAERRAPWRLEVAKERSHERALKASAVRIQERARRFAAQMAVIGAREIPARYAQAFADLATTSARTAHVEVAGHLATEQAVNPSADALTNIIDTHLDARMKRVGKGAS